MQMFSFSANVFSVVNALSWCKCALGANVFRKCKGSHLRQKCFEMCDVL